MARKSSRPSEVVMWMANMNDVTLANNLRAVASNIRCVSKMEREALLREAARRLDAATEKESDAREEG